MLTEICQYLRNWFVRDKLTGQFVVVGGLITYADGTALSLLEGQYYRVVGSVFNDGVHQYGTKEVTVNNATTEVLIDPLTDEPAFDGAVWLMAVPPDFLALVNDITTWTETSADAINSPYTSESFGGYSYTLRTASGSDGVTGGVTWQNQFKARLSPWRKI